jgi:hypothetical protein
VSGTPWPSEFTFELHVCRWVERSWPPAGAGTRPVVVGRQVGTRERRWDTVVVEVDPDALAERRRFGERGLDSDLLHVVGNAPAEWAWYRDALPEPGYPWRYVREAVHRAAARDLVEERKRDGRIQLRRVRPYPDWVRRVVAVENKPDLDAAAARSLADQLRHDVTAGLADEVWVATTATGASVEPALLEATPVEVGVLLVHPPDSRDDASDDRRGGTAGGEGVDASVAWHPARLDPDPDRADKRAELAERAYGRGWRSYLDSMRPDCRAFEGRHVGDAVVPWCAAKGRHQTSAECAGSCRSFEPEPPAWRTRGWPVEGGPGRGVRRVLDRRRERAREDATRE